MTRLAERIIWIMLLVFVGVVVYGYHWHKSEMLVVSEDRLRADQQYADCLEKTETIPECFCVEPGAVKKVEKTYRKEGFLSVPKDGGAR